MGIRQGDQMRDEECVVFLQWALPRLHMRWAGYRKVRGQVCKRLKRRIAELELGDLPAYRRHLARHPEEWGTLDALARVTISRFYRDRGVFERLTEEVLPMLALQARARRANGLRAWSAGAGGGEEPYTLAIAWHLRLQAAFPDLHLRILATEADANQYRRGREACYPPGSLRDLPGEWLDKAFDRFGEDRYCLKPGFRRQVEFTRGDLRTSEPGGPFDLVLCRNLAFTYFDEETQRSILARIRAAMRPGAALVLGAHEKLPEGTVDFQAWAGKLPIYRLGGAAGEASKS